MAKILLKNIKGPKGDKGDTGDIGIKGTVGTTGDTGATGDKGDTFSIKQVYDNNPSWSQINADLDVGDYYIAKQSGYFVLFKHGATSANEEKIATMSGDAGMKGEIGNKGATGDIGAKGETGNKGETGVGISSITTSTSSMSIKWSNNTSTNITMPTITNGSKGETGDTGKQCVYTLDDNGNLSYEIQ